MMSYKKLYIALVTLGVIGVGGSSAKAESLPLFDTNSTGIEQMLVSELQVNTPNKTKTTKKYKVKSGDTLTSIAKSEKTTIERLFSKNKQLSSPDRLVPGTLLEVPRRGEKLKRRDIPTLGRSPLKTAVRGSGGILAGSSVGNFEWGWCTWFAQSQRPDKVFSGNASDWIRFADSTQPVVGAIAVNTQGLGHVAIVIGVESDRVKVRHMNWQGFGVVSEDWISRSYWSGYIL